MTTEQALKEVDELTITRSVLMKLQKLDAEAAARVLAFSQSWNNQRLAKAATAPHG